MTDKGITELPGSPHSSPADPDRVRIYHGTFKDFDNFSDGEVFFASGIGFARQYAGGSEAPPQPGINIIHPSMQRIVVADIPIDVYKNNVQKYTHEIVLPAELANEYVIDDGRNSPLYGNMSCYNENYLPLNTENCNDPNNRVFNIPDGEKFFGLWAEGDYHANYWMIPRSFDKRIVHVFDKYYYDAKAKKIYYYFEDGSVLVTKGDDPLKNGFITLGMLDTRSYKKLPKRNNKLEDLWIPYDEARMGNTKMRRLMKRNAPIPILPEIVSTKQAKKSKPKWFKPPRMPRK